MNGAPVAVGLAAQRLLPSRQSTNLAFASGWLRLAVWKQCCLLPSFDLFAVMCTIHPVYAAMSGTQLRQTPCCWSPGVPTPTPYVKSDFHQCGGSGNGCKVRNTSSVAGPPPRASWCAATALPQHVVRKLS
jgi:hypothetical protein